MDGIESYVHGPAPGPSSLADYVKLINAGETFAVARYGDGEWGAVLGQIARTCFGDQVTPALSEAIADTLINSHPAPYWCASCTSPYTQLIQDWSAEHSVHLDEVPWTCGGVYEVDQIANFIEALRGKSVCVVGLPRLERLRTRRILPEAHMLPVAGPSCFERCDDVMRRLVNMEGQHGIEVVLFSCGLASVVMIHRAWSVFTGNVTLLDCGAMWDPYVGVESARGHRRPGNREIVQQVIERVKYGARPEDTERHGHTSL